MQFIYKPSPNIVKMFPMFTTIQSSTSGSWQKIGNSITLPPGTWEMILYITIGGSYQNGNSTGVNSIWTCSIQLTTNPKSGVLGVVPNSTYQPQNMLSINSSAISPFEVNLILSVPKKTTYYPWVNMTHGSYKNIIAKVTASAVAVKLGASGHIKATPHAKTYIKPKPKSTFM